MGKSRKNVAHKSLVDVKVSYRDESMKKDGTASVFLYLFLRRKRVIFKTFVSVKPEDWDYTKKKVKGNDEHSNDLNLIIDNCKARMNLSLSCCRVSSNALKFYSVYPL